MLQQVFLVGLLGMIFPVAGSGGTGAVPADESPSPRRQLVFKVQGLTWGAVGGLGWGSLLAPVLARLDQIKGVARSQADRTGTLIRVAVAATADRQAIAREIVRVLSEEKRNPVQLTGAARARALDRDKWYGPDELSAIEFRTLALRQVQAFAEAEKLDKATTDRLLTISREEWDRLAKAANVERKRPLTGGTDWAARCAQFAGAFLGRAKGQLTPEQVERLKRGSDRQLERLGQGLGRLRSSERCPPGDRWGE